MITSKAQKMRQKVERVEMTNMLTAVEFGRKGRYDLATLPRHRIEEANAMKLDMDLLRAVLIHVETEAKTPYANLDDIIIPPWNDNEIAYHVIRAKEAGLIDAYTDYLPDDEDGFQVSYSVHSLTYRGHELLAAMGNEGVWSDVKAGVGRVGALSIDVVFEFAKAFLKKKVQEVTGIDLG